MTVSNNVAYKIVNNYIALIKNRTGNDQDIKEIDRSTKIFLNSVIKEKTQNENIEEMQQLIDATIETGLSNDDLAKLKEIKIRIDILVKSLRPLSQDVPVYDHEIKAYEETVSVEPETKPTNRIDEIFEVISP